MILHWKSLSVNTLDCAIQVKVVSGKEEASLHINAEKYTEVLEKQMLHLDNVSFREGLAYFSKTMLNHILQHHNSMASREKSPGAELVCLQQRPRTVYRQLLKKEGMPYNVSIALFQLF